jgi:hypothetical protein
MWRADENHADGFLDRGNVHPEENGMNCCMIGGFPVSSQSIQGNFVWNAFNQCNLIWKRTVYCMDTQITTASTIVMTVHQRMSKCIPAAIAAEVIGAIPVVGLIAARTQNTTTHHAMPSHYR